MLEIIIYLNRNKIFTISILAFTLHFLNNLEQNKTSVGVICHMPGATPVKSTNKIKQNINKLKTNLE